MHEKADRFADGSLATLRRFTSIVSRRLLRTGNTDHAADNHHLLSLLREAGCPICNERSESERVHFFWLLNESCQQPSVLEEIAAGIGFCSAHAMHLINRGEYRDSLAYIYRWVIEDVLRQFSLRREKTEQAQFASITACYTCRILDEAVRNCGFGRLLATTEIWEFYARAGLLCARHLGAADGAEPSFRVGLLLEVHRAHLFAIRAALQSGSRPESDSGNLVRALLLTVGNEPHLVNANSIGLTLEWNPGERDAVRRLRGNLGRTVGCPICLEVLSARSDWYRWINGHSEIDENLGDLLPCCSFHTWELVRAGSPVTARVVALHLCQQLINDVHKGMGGLAAAKSRLSWVDRLTKVTWRVAPRRKAPWSESFSHSCPVCYRQAVAEERAISLLVKLLGERRAQSDYECGAGVCVRHLASILGRRDSTRIVPFLISAEETTLSLLAWEIDERDRKRAYQWRPEAEDRGDTTWRRALIKVSGSSDLAIGPSRRQD